MKNLLLVTLICLSANVISAQFGISARYQSNNVSKWNDQFSNEDWTDGKLFESSLAFGVNYWFRLKNKRIEFLPEVTYMNVDERDFRGTGAPDIGNFPSELTTFAFNSNIQIYPLDFDGDCNCPTFGKDGSLIKKGFYWIINPGVSYNVVSIDPFEGDHSSIIPRIGIGAGLDIGVQKYITISPFAMFNKDFGLSTDTSILPVYESTGRNSFTAGLRILFRPDYVKTNRALYGRRR